MIESCLFIGGLWRYYGGFMIGQRIRHFPPIGIFLVPKFCIFRNYIWSSISIIFTPLVISNRKFRVFSGRKTNIQGRRGRGQIISGLLFLDNNIESRRFIRKSMYAQRSSSFLSWTASILVISWHLTDIQQFTELLGHPLGR